MTDLLINNMRQSQGWCSNKQVINFGNDQFGKMIALTNYSMAYKKQQYNLTMHLAAGALNRAVVLKQ